MIALMSCTAYVAILQPNLLLEISSSHAQGNAKPTSLPGVRERYADCMRALAAPQLVLAILALTNFHVQIINRLCSGYPIWYIVLAIFLTSKSSQGKDSRSLKSQRPLPDSSSGYLVSYLRKREGQQWIFSSMVIYAIVQGGLYASFMPPA